MAYMVMTLEVSQPVRFGLPVQFRSRLLMLVTEDTTQELMGPYWDSIAVEFVHHCTTAVVKFALLKRVAPRTREKNKKTHFVNMRRS